MGAAEIRGKMAAADELPVTHDHGALENIAQFAHVARPGVAVKKLAHFGIDAANLPAVLGIEIAQNVLDQQGEIFLAIAQGRQMNVKHVQAEIEILPKLAVRNSLLGIFIGGREHAHVHRRFGLAAQAPDLAVLEHAQQLGLRGRRHFADFVQKERAAVGKLKAADAALGGSRESASFVPENLALHQRFRDGGAVDGHEGPVGARRKLMQCAREDLLARCPSRR